MPGLPLTDYERDMTGMRQLFTDPAYKPDMIKLYPCMVAQGTALYHQYKKGEFIPIDAKEAAKRTQNFTLLFRVLPHPASAKRCSYQVLGSRSRND